MRNTPKMIWSSPPSESGEDEIPQDLYMVLKTALGLQSACGAADEMIRTEALHYMEKARDEALRASQGIPDDDSLVQRAIELVF